MKRPLITVALCYGAGALLGHFVEAPLLATLLVALVLVAAALSFRVLRPILLPFVLLLFGWSNLTLRTALVSPNDLRTLVGEDAKIFKLRARLAEMPSLRVVSHDDIESAHTLAELSVTEAQSPDGDWRPAFGRIMSRTSGSLDSTFHAGRSVELTGVAVRPPLPIAPGVFDYRRHLLLRGIHYEFKVDSSTHWKVLGNPTSLPLDVRFRSWAQKILARGLPEADPSLRLQWAMLLGWQTALTAEVSEPFMRSGTMHIFAISGLHIALIAGIFLALFRALAIPRSVCGAIVIPVIWFYTAATGWQASAIRSTIMMTIIILGWSLKRPTDLLNSLAAAALIILVWQPEQLFQASFQLSFFVVLSIALLLPPIEQLRNRLFQLDPLLPYELRPLWQRTTFRGGRLLWRGFATSLAAFLGSVPLIAYYFHLFTPGSLVANLVVVPVSSLALMSGLGAIVTGDFLPPLTEWFNNSGWLWMRLMVWLSEKSADLPLAWFHVSGPGAAAFALYYGLLLAGCAGWFTHRYLRWVTLLSAVMLATAWAVDWSRHRMWHRLTALPLSGGHAVYVQPRDGGDWLLDCGSRRAMDFTLKPYLQAQGLNRLDHFLLTQGTARQIGGAQSLNELFPIRKTYSSPLASRSSPYREALADLEMTSKLQKCATNGFRFPPWTILHPGTSDRPSVAEDESVVALGDFDGVRVLLTSGLGKRGQNAFCMRHSDQRADIVISGLPTSGEPLADEWLEMLRPRLIVIVDSELPPTRRAGKGLRHRLQRHADTVLFTREAGAVSLAIRGGEWQVETAWPVSAIE